MSLLIGISLGSVAILASDSLHVWTTAGVTTRNDAVEKIHQTPRGLAAGIGLINVFDPVLKNITANGFKDPAEITQQLQASFTSFVKRPEAQAAVQKDRTAIMATYNNPEVRLRSCHQDDNFVAEDLDGRIMSLLPAGSTSGKHVDQRQRLVEALNTGDLKVVIRALKEYFRFFHEAYPDEVGSGSLASTWALRFGSAS
jgi:hypothetical protein